MRRKFLHTGAVVIFSVGFYVLGLYTHRQAIINNNTYNTSNSPPNFVTDDQPYSSFAYKKCISRDVPDDQDCFNDLFNSTMAEANDLANKLVEATPKGKINDAEVVEYFNSRNTYIEALHDNVGQSYLDNFCGLDTMRIYGGTGMRREEFACRYYHVQQYLDLLKYLEQDSIGWGGTPLNK